MGKSKFYAVANGRTVGIFTSWLDCERQVKGFSGAKYKSFFDKNAAESFLRCSCTTIPKRPSGESSATTTHGSIPPNPKRSRLQDDTLSSRLSSNPANSNKETMTSLDPSSLPAPLTKTMQSADLSLLLSFDGGSRGNPGLAGSGAEVVSSRRATTHRTVTTTKSATTTGSTTTSSSSANTSTDTGTQIFTRSKTRLMRFLRGNKTNNQAEYWGLITGLECVCTTLKVWIQKTEASNPSDRPLRVSLVIQGDSDLIIQQMNGAYKVGHVLLPNFQRAQEWMEKIRELCRSNHIQLDCILQHVYREDNVIADECANQAMDAKASWAVHSDNEGNETRTKLTDVENDC